jgi:uncharacterized membrane protein YdjX (TVP38/TMEM64 family)
VSTHSKSRAAKLFEKHGAWLGGALTIGALVAAWFLLPVREWLEPFEAWVDGAGAIGVLVFIGVYALAAVLFVPGALLTIAAGLAFGLWKGVLVAWIGATLGATLAFLIARYALRSAVEARAKKNPKFQAMDDAIAKQGWKVVALLRLSPLLPYNVSNYVYGVTRIPLVHYVAASAIGMLPGTFLYVYIGSIGNMASSSGGATAWKWTLALVGVIATAAVTVWISRVARRSVHAAPSASGHHGASARRSSTDRRAASSG